MTNKPEGPQTENIVFDTTAKEVDTYDQLQQTEKEELPPGEIQAHWEIRAERADVQAVMSARHSLDENREATRKLHEDVVEFLEGQIEGKKVFELGVGIGRMTTLLAQKAKSVDGCDFSAQMLERAKQNLSEHENIQLMHGKITDLDLPPKSYDLVFESIVLLHILNPEELRNTVQKMQSLSDKIFIVEHTFEGPGFPISKFTILRKPEEYEEIFKPYKLVKQKTHISAGDTFTMMLFEKPEENLVNDQISGTNEKVEQVIQAVEVKKKLTPEQHEKLLATLKTRFEANMNRHKGMEWSKVQARLEARPEKMWSLNEMERTKGEPDVVEYDEKTGEYVFFDCSRNSPEGRRDIAYDKQAEELFAKLEPPRKCNGNAVDLAKAMGIEILDSSQYMLLQKIDPWHDIEDAWGNSWVKTPDDIRNKGRAYIGSSRNCVHWGPRTRDYIFGGWINGEKTVTRFGFVREKSVIPDDYERTYLTSFRGCLKV